MKKGKKAKSKLTKKKIFIRLFIVVAVIYAIIILVNQQRTLSSYDISSKDLDVKIAEAKKRKEELLNTKNNIDSKEYIEKIAREKLDMYLPNERIYVNIGN